MTRLRKTSPEPAARTAVSEPQPGVPFTLTACKCLRCERVLTSAGSVSRGAGAKCYEHLRGQGAYARLEAQGQERFPWADAEARP